MPVARASTGLRLLQRHERSIALEPARQDRPARDEPPQVFGELAGCRVSFARLLGECLQNDRLEVARNPPVELPEWLRGLVQDSLDQLDPVRFVKRRP